MEAQIWDMIVKTERELLERRLTRKASHGRPTDASRERHAERPARGWRLNPFSSPRVPANEAS